MTDRAGVDWGDFRSTTGLVTGLGASIFGSFGEPVGPAESSANADDPLNLSG